MNKINPVAYRPCVGVMLINRGGDVFTGQRIDKTSDHWQMPQGGIDEGEAPTDAAFRELYEETGIEKQKVELITVGAEWVKYDLPDHLMGRLWDGLYRGQEQKWFLMGFLGEDADIRLDLHEPEFSEWRWQSLELLPHVIVPFKRGVYTRVMEEFRPHITTYIAGGSCE